MRLIGLELSDAGILAVNSATDELLKVDGTELESPGFALPGKNGFRMGRVAERNAHLKPRYIVHNFWDQLNTEPLKQPGFERINHSELAYAHLKQIWETVKQPGDAAIIAVPGFFSQEQLGLILGIAKELSMPVKGFVPIALAASSKSYLKHLLLFLDAHLHRFEITALAQKDRLYPIHTESLTRSGLYQIHTDFVSIVSDTFVQQTRYDPFHQAASEQELYNRLPALIKEIQSHTSTYFQMTAGAQTHRIRLTPNPFVEKIKSVFHEICQIIDNLRKQYGESNVPVVLQVTHRARRLFGFKDVLGSVPDIPIVSLQPGAAAFGALQLADQFSDRRGARLLSSRTWLADRTEASEKPVSDDERKIRPTHLLYRNLAYPLTTRPLVIGKGVKGAAPDLLKICSEDNTDEMPVKYCTIRLQGDDAWLVDHGKDDIFVDENRVSQTAILKLGQHIRVGPPSESNHENIHLEKIHHEKIRLIACIKTDET